DHVRVRRRARRGDQGPGPVPGRGDAPTGRTRATHGLEHGVRAAVVRAVRGDRRGYPVLLRPLVRRPPWFRPERIAGRHDRPRWTVRGRGRVGSAHGDPVPPGEVGRRRRGPSRQLAAYPVNLDEEGTGPKAGRTRGPPPASRG